MDAMIGPRNRDNTESEKEFKKNNRKGQSLKVETRSLYLISTKSRNKNYKIKPKDKKNRLIAVFLVFKGDLM